MKVEPNGTPPIQIAPSLLAADALEFRKEIASVEAAGIDLHHVDVMDGHFVPNLSYGLPLVKAFKSIAKVPLDVHIMISNPDDMALEYVKAGADILVFHIEAAKHPHRIIQAIHAAGARAGLAINPGTSLTCLEALLDDVDVVNVMAVNPGFGGQSFIPQTINRVATLHDMLRRRGRVGEVAIEVDGGINEKTGADVSAAGASWLVAGTHIYGKSDRTTVVSQLRQAAQRARMHQ